MSVLVRAFFRLLPLAVLQVFVIVIVIAVSVGVPVTRSVRMFVFVQMFVFVVVIGGKVHVGMRRPVGVRVFAFSLKVHPKDLAQAAADSCPVSFEWPPPRPQPP